MCCMGINRNIVECKVSSAYLLTKSIMRINRNIVECKVSENSSCRDRFLVLIETLWNVKKAEVEKMLQSGKMY